MASAQAKLIMQQDPLILDTETTGLQGDAEICEIAVMDSHGRTLIDQLVNPVGSIPPEVTEIHGITNDEVDGAPGFEHLWPQLTTTLVGRTVVIFNSDFDLRLLRQSGKTAGVADMGALHSISRNTFCAMKLYAQYYGAWNRSRGSYAWQSLNAAGLQCGIALPPDLHRARADVALTLKVMEYMAG